MCGIAGYIGPRHIDEHAVQSCLRLMYPRGPDASGVYRSRTSTGSNVLLLNRRLAIIDLDERANQPFRYSDKVITLNGEIYNYVELREELRRADLPLRTLSDTEALVALLHHENWKGLDRAEGMWAFACYDESRQELLLSRDRFGEKPLYLLRDKDGGLYFGSEVKFIAALAGYSPSVNRDHLCRYLVNGYKALYKDGNTFFDRVTELSPGSCLMCDRAGRTETVRYWQLPRLAQDENLSFEDCGSLVREALVQSVRLRLRSDVPLAFCLSGGVDSNALISIAKRVLGYDVHAFTIVNHDPRYDEREMVDIAVQELQLRHTAIPIDHSGFLENLRALVCQHDAPVYTISYYIQWQMMRRIAESGYKVSISGTAADELFSGYYDHHNFYLAHVRDIPDLYRAALRDWERFVAPIVRNPYLQDPEVFVRNSGERGHIFLNADEFSDYLTNSWSQPFSEASYEPEPLRNRMLNELFHESVPPILHEDDLNAMYFSIENRSPFLDRAMFELTMRIPTRHLVRRGRAKALLREAVRGIAPDAIIDNPRKVGFNAPIFELLNVQDPEVRDRILDDSPIFTMVHRDRIETLLERAELPNSESKFLFYFLNAKIFLEQFGT